MEGTMRKLILISLFTALLAFSMTSTGYCKVELVGSEGGGGGVPPTERCGDGICQLRETHNNCQIDCPSSFCPNGICEDLYGENGTTCRPDCPVSCGDGICQVDETHNNCQIDCPSLSCPNGICEAIYGENSQTCRADCPVRKQKAPKQLLH